MPIKSCDVAVVSSYRFPAELNVIMLKSPKLVRLADFYLRQHKKGLDNFLICYLHILLNSSPPPPFYTRSFSFFLFKYFREEKQTGCVVSLFSQMNWNAPKNLVFFFLHRWPWRKINANCMHFALGHLNIFDLLRDNSHGPLNTWVKWQSNVIGRSIDADTHLFCTLTSPDRRIDCLVALLLIRDRQQVAILE